MRNIPRPKGDPARTGAKRIHDVLIVIVLTTRRQITGMSIRSMQINNSNSTIQLRSQERLHYKTREKLAANGRKTGRISKEHDQQN